METREQIIQNGYEKIKTVVNRMKSNLDLKDIKEIISITPELSIEVNCLRNEVGYAEYIGRAYDFGLYAIKNKKDIDGIQSSQNFDEDIMYLLNCYV